MPLVMRASGCWSGSVTSLTTRREETSCPRNVVHSHRYGARAYGTGSAVAHCSRHWRPKRWGEPPLPRPLLRSPRETCWHHSRLSVAADVAFAHEALGSGDDKPLAEELAAPTEALSIREIDVAVIQNTLTCSAQAIADPFMSVVDTAFVGRLGTVALASLGPNSALFNCIFYMMGLTGAIVTTEYVGLAHAVGDTQGVQRALVLSAVVFLVVGVVAMLALLVHSRAFLAAMGTNAEMMPHALVYLRIRALAVPASLLLIVAQSAYRGVMELRTPCVVVLGLGLLNAALDPLLMFGLGWGVAGAAIATSAAQWAGVFIFLALMWRSPTFRGPAATRPRSLHATPSRLVIPWPSRADLLRYLRDCSTLLLRAATIILIYTLAGIAAAKKGTVAAAGHQLVNQLQMFQITVLWAFLEVGQSMVLNAKGARGRGAARAVADRVVWWCVLTSLLMAAGTWALRDVLPRLFLQDEGVLAAVRGAIAPTCTMLLFGWNNALEGALLGAGDTRFVVAGFVPSAGIGILMLFYALYYGGTLPLGGDLAYIWWALAIYYIVLTILYCFRYWVPSLRGPL